MSRESILQDVLQRIRSRTGHGLKPRGDWHDGRCPAHEDKHNSFSVTAGDKRIIFKCRAGCTEDACAKALGFANGVKDLFYESAAKISSGRKKSSKKKTPLTIAELARAKGFAEEFLKEQGCREDEKEKAVIIPYKREAGDPAARHRIRSTLVAKEGSRWTGTSEDGAPIPYGLWRLNDARAQKFLVLCEGETDAWSLWSIDMPALGLPGASMTGKLDEAHLEGIDKVYIIEEPDRGGVTFVQGLSERLAEVGWQGKAFIIKCAPHGKDPNDMLLKLRDGFADAFRGKLSAAQPIEAVVSFPVDYNESNVADLFLAAAPRPTLFCESEENGQKEGTRILLHRDTLYEFDGRAYRELPESELQARITSFIRSRDWINRKGDVEPAVAKQAFVRSAIMNVASAGCVPASVQPPVWINGKSATRSVVLKNGILDLAEFFHHMDDDENPPRLKPHTDELFTYHAMPYAFDPKAECPRWTKFLDEVLPDHDVQRVLQDWFGYCLIPTQQFEKIMVLVGEGKNGKSVIMRMLKHLVGAANCSAVDLEFLAEPHALQPMEGKLVNFASEWAHLKPSGAAVLKKISGGDPATVNPKGSKAYMANIVARFIVSSNDPPSITDRSDAFWRRLLTVPFDIQIDQDKQIPIDNLTASLSEELPGIFLWALRGLYALEKNNGFVEAAAMVQMKNLHREESNPEAAWADMCLDIEDGAKTASSILYQDYQEFCKRGGYRARNEARFGRELVRWYRKQTGQQLKKVRERADGLREYRYIGISLTVPIPETDPARQLDWASDK